MRKGGAYRVANPGDEPELIERTQTRRDGQPFTPARDQKAPEKPAKNTPKTGGKSK